MEKVVDLFIGILFHKQVMVCTCAEEEDEIDSREEGEAGDVSAQERSAVDSGRFF